jgi:hypothetical protein
MSYWSGGYRKIPDQFTVNMHKVCAYFLKQNFGEVHFITDDTSLPYFKDINFSSVAIEFNDVPKEYGETWSINKLLAYKLIAKKGDPFVHVDYDVILWKGLEDRLKKADVFAQSNEVNSQFYYEIDKFKANCPNLHIVGKVDVPEGINVGIIGGNDLEFLYNYSESALELILDPKNKDFWLNYRGFSSSWNKAVIAEQYYLAAYSKYYNKKVETLFACEWPSDKQAEEKQYTHGMNSKNDVNFRNKIELMVNKLGL